MKHISASVVPWGQNFKILKLAFATYKSCWQVVHSIQAGWRKQILLTQILGKIQL